MKQFYDYWRKKTEQYVSLADVVCFIPLVGYFSLRGDDVYKITRKGRDKFGAQIAISFIEKVSNPEILDKAIEMATCQLITLPISEYPGNEMKVLLNGNGRGRYTIPGVPCPCQVPLLSNNCKWPECPSKPFEWWSGETCI